MFQYTCNALLAHDLLLPLAQARIEYRLTWPRPDCAVFETGDPVAYASIQKHGEILNAFASGSVKILPTEQWGIWDDLGFPLTSPADLRNYLSGHDNLNLWEDATHQITFDGGKHWTNVILEEGNPEYYVACSDGKTSWLVDMMTPKWVVSRPLRNDREYQGTVTGRISDPQPQPILQPFQQRRLERGACIGCGNKVVNTPCRLCGSPGRIRQPATVGDTPACPMTDTCFDSDPSVVGE